MDKEVETLLKKLEEKMLKTILETPDMKTLLEDPDLEIHWFGFDVDYGWFKSCYIQYEMHKPFRYEYNHKDPYPIVNIGDGSGVSRISEATGKELKILCQYGDKILANTRKSLEAHIEKQVNYRVKENKKMSERIRKRQEKKDKQMKVCKTNLKKILEAEE